MTFHLDENIFFKRNIFCVAFLPFSIDLIWINQNLILAMLSICVFFFFSFLFFYFFCLRTKRKYHIFRLYSLSDVINENSFWANRTLISISVIKMMICKTWIFITNWYIVFLTPNSFSHLLTIYTQKMCSNDIRFTDHYFRNNYILFMRDSVIETKVKTKTKTTRMKMKMRLGYICLFSIQVECVTLLLSA